MPGRRVYIVDPPGGEQEVSALAEHEHRKSTPGSPLVLSFAWLAVIGRLFRMRTLSTGGFGHSRAADGRVLPWYCEYDDSHQIRWYPESMGVPPCRIPDHLLEGGHRMTLDRELTKDTYGEELLRALRL
jgi:hypothetical protein